MSKEDFFKRMEEIRTEPGYDEEMMHIYMDKLMCEALVDLGYEDGIKVFENTGKWYS